MSIECTKKECCLTKPLILIYTVLWHVAAIHREKELMESLEHNAPVNTSQPLESILANFKPTATVGVSVNGKKTNSELSDEAKKVLLRLPDLSFMKARVLMFPVKQS